MELRKEIKAVIKRSKGLEGTWDVKLYNPSDEEGKPEYQITELEECTPSEMYVKFGIKLPGKEQPDPEGDTKKLVERLIKNTSGKKDFTVDEVNNLLLDVYNSLGGKEIDTLEEGEDD